MTLDKHIHEATSDQLTGEPLLTYYVPVREAIFWDRNPKKHDIGEIVTSIYKYGFRDPSTYDATLGALVTGNGRAEALAMMEKQNPRKIPRGILAHKETGVWHMPINFGVDAASKSIAEQYGIDHNNTVLAGEFTIYDMARMWNKEEYKDLLKSLSEDGEDMPLTMSADDMMLLLNEQEINSQEVPDGSTTSSQEDGLDDHEYAIFTITVNNVNIAEDVFDEIKALLEENPGWDAEIGRHK